MTREEAIKEIKSWDFLEGKEIEAIHTLIPELAESEDERIIKTLQEYVKNRNWTLNGPTQDEVLAWLEKQKESDDFPYSDLQEEQKPTEKLSKEEYVKRFKTLCDAHEIKLPNREYDIYHLCKDLHKLFGDADIQKPTEWSEEDEDIRQSIIKDIKWERDNTPVTVYKDIRKYDKQIAWLKSLYPQKLDASKLENFDPVDVLNRIKKEWPMVWEKVVPKQEWSEEEMKLLDSIIDDYEKASRSFCGYDGKIGFLKAIHNGEYNLPKPAWSEEDEEMLDLVIGDVRDAKEILESKDAKDFCDREIAWQR